jgi:Ca2+:H+ antiporter
MGAAVEEIALVVGPSIGGLLSATFGNAAELIIALAALRAGLVDVVKASITGCIIGNLLLVMGLSMFLGGLKYREQKFQPIVARVNASSMNLAVIAILLPTAVNYTSVGISEPLLQQLSSAVAIVLIVVYALTLLFSMKTHSYLYEAGIAEYEATPNADTTSEHAPEHTHQPNLWRWIGVLLAATLAVAYESESLVETLEETTSQLGLTELFTGVILLPIIGSAAENAAAIVVATKNKMDLSISVAMGSCLQVSLFVAPLLVLVGLFIGQPMDLNFNPFELVAVAVSVFIANTISYDGQSNWLEGTLLLATYIILGVAFFFHPDVPSVAS